MNVARSSLRITVANVAGALVSFAGVVFFSRELGAAAVGTYFLFEAAVGVLAIPADLGLRGAAEKRISEGEDRAAVLTSAALLKLAPLSVLVGVVVLASEFINGYVGANVAVLLAVALVLREAAYLMLRVLQGELRVGETAILRFVRQGVWVGCGGVLVVLGYGSRGLIYGLFASYLVMLAVGFLKRSVPFGPPSAARAKSLFAYAKYNFVSGVGGYFYSWLDVLVIGLFLSQAHVGAYETAWRVTTFFVLFSNAIATTIFPQVSEWDGQGDTDRLEALLTDVITPAVVFVVPGFFGALLFADEILTVVFGPEFAIASTVLVILMFEKVVQAVHIVLGKTLQGLDYPDLAAQATLVAVGLNVVLNVVLIREFGLVGAAVATTASFVANACLHARYLSKHVSIRLPYADLRWLLVASLGMTAVLAVVQRAVTVTTLPGLLAVVSVGAIVYCLVVLARRPLRTKLLRNAREIL